MAAAEAGAVSTGARPDAPPEAALGEPGEREPAVMSAPLALPARRFRPRPPAPGTDVTVLFLGLKLVLLAFFVLLVAMSHREDSRSRLVLASLHAAFAAHVPDRAALPFDDGPDLAAAGARLEAVERLLRASLPLSARLETTAAGELRLRLLEAELFEGDRLEPRAERRVLLRRLAGLLGHAPGRHGLRAELTLTVAGLDVEEAALARARARLAALEAELVALGAPAAMIVPGLTESAARELRVTLVAAQAPGADHGRR